jgi:DNA-binding phage protein
VPPLAELRDQIAALGLLTPLEQARAIDEILKSLEDARLQALRAAVDASSQAAVARELGVTRQNIQRLMRRC